MTEPTPDCIPELQKSTLSDVMEGVKPLIQKSTLTETDSEGDYHEDSWVEERDSNRLTCKTFKYVGACFLLLLLLIGGMVYYFHLVDTKGSGILPSTIEALQDTSKMVGEDGPNEILFQLDREKESLEGTGSGGQALAEARNSLSNFDLESHSFLKDNQWIDQDTRKRLRVGPSNKDYYLQQQSDGNLVLYDNKLRVFWQSGVHQAPSANKRYVTAMQTNGNLITASIVGNRWQLEWISYSTSTPNTRYNVALTPGRNGLMIVRRHDRRIIFSTNVVAPAPTPQPVVPPTQPPRTPPPVPQPSPQPRPPTPKPISQTARITYTPGKLTRRENGLLLSEGLKSRLVAKTGQKLILDGRGGQKSSAKFHMEPDGAAVFRDPDTGGWIYVSNSEALEEVYGQGKGGVGAIYFDKHGRTTDYRMLHTGSTANCSGGKTPWNTWVTCEEYSNGQAFQVDPYGKRGIQPVTMDRGWFESFAYDIRDRNNPRFFVTEDDEKGALRRLTPVVKNWDDPWQLLHAPGTIQYLVLEPGKVLTSGTYRWTYDKNEAEQSAKKHYPFSEGMDVYKNQLFFTTKVRRNLFILNLDSNTYQMQSTRAGVFDGEPDQVKRIVGDGLLYFCEENGSKNGVHARDQNGWWFTILEADTFRDETTGLAFSPDAKRMYVSFQHTGQIFDIWREDGLPFDGKTLDIRYHIF